MSPCWLRDVGFGAIGRHGGVAKRKEKERQARREPCAARRPLPCYLRMPGASRIAGPVSPAGGLTVSLPDALVGTTSFAMFWPPFSS